MRCGGMRRVILAIAIGAWIAAGAAAAAPYGYDEIRLGASLDSLARELDLRDAEGALREAQERRAAKPDLGRRGYGCMRRDDPYSDITCVSHDERVDGIETREIRLHFIAGVLLQFSITAEIRYLEHVLAALTRRFGAPLTEPAGGSGGPRYRWRNTESWIEVHPGPSLVFVSFESADYAVAVRRKSGAGARR